MSNAASVYFLLLCERVRFDTLKLRGARQGHAIHTRMFFDPALTSLPNGSMTHIHRYRDTRQSWRPVQCYNLSYNARTTGRHTGIAGWLDMCSAFTSFS